MNYLKSTIKNLYQKVIQDEYLQILTENQVYLIINMTNRRRLSSVGKDPRKQSMSAQELQQQLFGKIQEMGNVLPERIFKIIGVQPSITIVKDKLKEMEENLSEISDVMQENFGKYQKRINLAIEGLDNTSRIAITRNHSAQLRNKLKSLQSVSKKSKKIAQLNIKATNIKKLLKLMSQIPNIKKMSLTQLKSISLQTIKSKQTLSSLKCLKGLQLFINHAVSFQLSKVLQKIKQCLIDKFNEIQYENALKDFIIAQHQTIKYENLLLKIIENQIRYIQNEEKYQIGCIVHDDGEGDGGNGNGNNNRWVYGIAEGYIKFLINLHEVFKWHRTNQKQQKWQHLSKGYYGISIQITIPKITQKIISVMDQCLKDIVLQTLYQSQSPTSNLQLLYIILRLSQICNTFSGINLSSTLKQSTQFIVKKIYKIKEKAWNQLEETYKLEERNSWNRLPVVDTYSHQPLDKCLYQIYRHKNSQPYEKVINVLRKSYEILKGVKVQTLGVCVGVGGGLVNMWDFPLNAQIDNIVIRQCHGLIPVNTNPTTTSTPTQQKVKFFENEPIPIPPPSSQPQPSPSPSIIVPEWQTQTWQIQPAKFRKAQKFEKNKSLVALKLKPIQIKLSATMTAMLPFKAIICQYSLTILKYMEMFTKYCFYFPVEPVLSGSLENIRLMIQYYIYQIFTGFLSQNIKTVFFQKLQNMTTQQQRYHKRRLHYTYPNISTFIKKFKQTHKLTQREYPDSSPSPSSSSLKHSNSISYSSSPNIPIGGGVGGVSVTSSVNIGGAGDALLKENLMVRSRVVALESLLYVLQYYGHVCEIIGLIKENKNEMNGNNIENGKQEQSLYDLHPKLAELHSHSYKLYLTLYNELSQILYTDFVPKLCNLKNTHSLVQSIKWNDSQYPIQEYVQVFGKNCTEFYFKMNSNSKGEVPTHICERLYGVYWRTQLTTIMKSFITTFKPGKSSSSTGSTTQKHKLEHFIDSLYEIVSQAPKQKSYIRIPYEKMKAIFPILMENKWENAFELLKLSLSKYEFIYVVEMGLGLISESCCYLSNQDIEDRKKVMENWIQTNLIENFEDNSNKKKEK